MRHFLLLLIIMVGVSAQGQLVNVIGDSYVKNHKRPVEESWHCLAAKELGLTYENYGRNGGCVAWDRSTEGFGPSLLVRYKELNPAADIVLIIAGHNDADKVKANADSLAAFTAAAGLLIDFIRLQCPHAKVGWVTPWDVPREGFEQVNRAIRKVCKKKRVAVLNTAQKDAVIRVRDAEFRKKYFQGANDFAHLNAEGHRLFLPTGEAFLRKLMP